MIQLINSKNINKDKWNVCIQNSLNPLFYFLFEVIDIASNGKWEALIEDDYRNVFPLPYKIKFGIKYYYTPFWIQRVGWINHDPNLANTNTILKASYIDLFVQNIDYEGKLNRINYILDLKNELVYSNNTQRNLKKSNNLDIKIEEVKVNSPEFVNYFAKNKGMEFKNIDASSYKRLEKIITFLNSKKLLIEIVAKKNEEIISIGIFVNFCNCFTYFKGCNSNSGNNTGAGHLIIDYAIKKAIQLNNKQFDFYGGNNAGMAQFYSGFGAKPQAYKHLLKNNLPKALQWLKKN